MLGMNRKTLVTASSGAGVVAVIGTVVGISVAASGSTPAKPPTQPAAATVTASSTSAAAASSTPARATSSTRRVAAHPADVTTPSDSSATVSGMTTPATDPTTSDMVNQGPGQTSDGVLRPPSQTAVLYPGGQGNQPPPLQAPTIFDGPSSSPSASPGG